MAMAIFLIKRDEIMTKLQMKGFDIRRGVGILVACTEDVSVCGRLSFGISQWYHIMQLNIKKVKRLYYPQFN